MVDYSGVALDTNIVIGYFRGDTHVRDLLEKYQSWFLPSIVVGELLFGALNSGLSDRNTRKYLEFISLASILTIDLDSAKEYAQLRLDLKKNGRPIPENDLWIAASVKSANLPLVSRDKHLDGLEGLTTIVV